MRHWMIDIETLDIQDTAVVLSVGIVPFDLDVSYPSSITALMDSGFYYVLDTPSQVALGRTVNMDTLAWHLADDARCEMLRGYFDKDGRRYPVPDAILDLQTILSPKDYIWGNAPSFDLDILRSLYADFGYTFPIPFYRELCYRTMKNLNTIQLEAKNDALAHNALYDAAYQARQLQRMRDAT